MVEFNGARIRLEIFIIPPKRDLFRISTGGVGFRTGPHPGVRIPAFGVGFVGGSAGETCNVYCRKK